MVEFVLDQDIQMRRQPKMEVIRQVRVVVPPGQGENLDRIPLSAQIFNQLTVIEISAAHGIERTIDYETDVHY